MERKTILAVDIGGTKYSVGLVSENGVIISKQKYTWWHISEESIIAEICTAMQNILDENPRIVVTAVGITITGLTDSVTGNWVSATYMGVYGLPIGKRIREKFGFPVYVENECNASAVAEKMFGLCRKTEHFMYLSVGNGIGGALFLDGKLYRGAFGAAGEVGSCRMDEIASFIIAFKMILYGVMNLTKCKSIYFNDTCTWNDLYFCTFVPPNEWIMEKDYTEETVEVKKMTLLSNPTHVYAKEPVVFYEMTELMKQADHEVLFHTPYIICNDWMMRQLVEVCEGEKEIRMMTNSVANNGNPFGAMDYRRNRGKIIDTGVQIMEYDDGVSYHGKCFTIDGRLTGIGSFNWDMRSAYLDTELMLVADSEELTRQMNQAMAKYEEKALKVVDERQYDLKEGQKPRKLSDKKAFRIKVLDIFGSWARFLM